MTDSIAVLPPGFRLLDNSGLEISGGTINFYDAGTTNARTVYSNSGLSTSLGTVIYTNAYGTPVASSGSSTAVIVYTGSSAYKVIIKDGSGSTLVTLDNIKGALDTSTFLQEGSTSTLTLPVSSKTADYTVVAADRGKIINADSTGGSFTLTLTSAVTLGDNWFVFIRNNGTANAVKIAASQAIATSMATSTVTSFGLRPGAGVLIGCNGVTFMIVVDASPFLNNTNGVLLIYDRVSAAPGGSPVPGSRYIVSGAFSTFEQGDVIEADGAGGFFEITPPSDVGWLAYVIDETVYYSFQGSDWVKMVTATLPAGQLLLTSGAASGATLDIVLTSYTSYRAIKIVLTNLLPAVDDRELWMRFSTDGGATYDAGASDYSWSNHLHSSVTAAGHQLDNADTELLVAGGANATQGVGSASTEGVSITVDLFDQTSAAAWSRIIYDATWIDAAATPESWRLSGAGARRAAQNTDAVRFLFETGNITSGSYAVYGYV